MKIFRPLILMLLFPFSNYAQCPTDSIPVFAAVDTFMGDSCYNNSFMVDGVYLSQASGYTNPDTSYQLHNTVYGVTEQGGYLNWQTNGHSNMGFGYRIGIWLDLDNNGFFEPNEYVGGDVSIGNSAIMSSGFNVPLETISDTLKLRLIKVGSTDNLTPEAACGDMAYPYGEVEDYYIIVNCALSPNIFYNSFEEICYQPSYLLFAFPDYGGILWYSDTLAPAIADSSELEFNPVVGDTTYYFQFHTNGCTENEFIPIDISVFPSPVVSILGPDTVVSCTNYTFDAGPSVNSYQWFTGETTQSITVNTAYGGFAWVTVTNVFNCSATDYVVASISPDPPATYATYYLGQNYCDNGVVSLNYDSIISPGTIDWYDNSMNLIASGNWVQYTPVDAENDTIIGIINSVCGIDTANIIVDIPESVSVDSIYSPEIMIGLSGDPLFCYSSGSITVIAAGATTTIDHWFFSDTTTGAGLNYGYGLDTISLSTAFLTVGNVYSATVVMQNSAGCFVNVDSVFATAANTYNLNFTDTNTLCQFPSLYGPGIDDVQYDIVWNTGDNVSPIIISNQGLYTLSIYDNNTGCSDFDSTYIIEASSLFNPIEDSILVCGTDITLDAGIDFQDYIWEVYDDFGNFIDQANTQQYFGIFSGIYYLQVISNEGCDLFDTSVVNIFPAITIDLGPDGNTSSSTYTINGPIGFTSYQWSNGATTQNITVNSAGTYTLTVTNANGCTAVDSVGITFSVGVNDLAIDLKLEIFPVPVNQAELTVSFSEEILFIEIYNMEGKLVKKLKCVPSFTQFLDVKSLKNGIYSLRVGTVNSVYNKKITVQR